MGMEKKRFAFRKFYVALVLVSQFLSPDEGPVLLSVL